jgi:putative peptide zinc metalloprotease protein
MVSNYPKLRDDLIIRRQVLGGEVGYMVKTPDPVQYLRYGEIQWAIISQLNGQTSYEETAERFNQQHPDFQLDAGQVEDFVVSLKKQGVVERTPAERSIAILEKLEAERKKRAEQSQAQDIFYLTLATVNPEKFYKRIYPYLRWMWTPQFVAATLLMFAAAAGVIISNWSLVRAGIGHFWRLEGKTTNDIVMLFCILAVIVVIHESAHALTCMNFGGKVDEVGFMLIYFMPAFYANVSDAYLFDKKWPKYWVTLAGGYSELILCSFSVYTWALTEPGSFANHLAYNIMVFAGLSTIIFNYNPLIKLDGYYLLSDILEVTNLRSNAANYIVYVIKKHVFRVATPPPSGLTPRKKRIYRIYGPLSVAYVTFIVTMFVLFLFRFFTRHFPEMGIFLGFFASLLILRKRIRKLMKFSRFVYLDKREWLTQKASARRWAYATGALLLLFLLYPFSHKVSGQVVLEPLRQLPLRAETEGFITEVAANHDGLVPAGTLVVKLGNNELVALRQEAQGEVERRRGEAASALAAGDMAGYQAALREQQRAENELAELRRQESRLEIRAPFEGSILTPRLQDLLGRHVAPGEFLCDFGDLRTMRARIQVSEFDVAELREGQPVRLKVSSFPGESFKGRVAARSQAAPDAYDAAGRPAGLVRTVQASPAESASAASGKAKSEGTPFSHFEMLVEIPNTDGKLLPGMSGVAKINPDRHGVAVRIYRSLRDIFRSKVWW